MITSPHNDKLKTLRRLQRRRDGRFVAEGEDLLAAADAAGWEPLERYVAAGSGLAGTEVEPGVLAGVSQLGSGTRALAVYRRALGAGGRGAAVRALWGVRDPGNVGTVLRSAPGLRRGLRRAGPATAPTPTAPRRCAPRWAPCSSCRSSAWRPSPSCRARPSRSWRGPASRCAVRRPAPSRVVVGAEREGLPGEVVAGCDRVAHIPIASESLNAAMAATVALYELSREP